MAEQVPLPSFLFEFAEPNLQALIIALVFPMASLIIILRCNDLHSITTTFIFIQAIDLHLCMNRLLYLLGFFLLISSTSAYSQPFDFIETNFEFVNDYSSDWGDIDGDGDMDLFMNTFQSQLIAGQLVYENQGNFSFTPVLHNERPSGTLRLHDMDGDLDLDVFNSGGLFRNDGTAPFSEIDIFFPPRTHMAWGDIDADGDLDLTGPGSHLVQTEPGVWQTRSASWYDFNDTVFFNVCFTEVLDFDMDGYLDVLNHCRDFAPNPMPTIYRQTGAFEFEVAHEFTFETRNIQNVIADDFDSDGDIDVLIANGFAEDGTVELYENNALSFTPRLLDVPSTEGLTSGDIDGDGNIDIVAVVEENDLAVLYQLFGDGAGSFTQEITNLNITVGDITGLTLVDIDSDGSLDLTFEDRQNASRNIFVFRNTQDLQNTPPEAPTGLQVAQTETTTTFSWNQASDAESPSENISYRIRIGTQPGASDVLPSQSLPESGKPLIVKGLHAWRGLTRIIDTLPAGTYYWAVQAIDPSGNGSLFSDEASFVSGGGPIAAFEQTHILTSTSNSSAGALWGDMEGDGDLDVLLEQGDFDKTLFENDGSGNFSLAEIQIRGGTEGWQDVDHDGDLDPVEQTVIQLNNLDLGYAYLSDNGSNLDPDSDFNGCRGGYDYDQDGDLDWFAEGNSTLGIHRNAGNLAFNRVIIANDNIEPVSAFNFCFWYDYDADGDQDILFTPINRELKESWIYRNDGPEQFTQAIQLPDFPVQHAAAGDFDQDGDDDLALIGYSTTGGFATFQLYRNDRDGTLTLLEDAVSPLPETIVTPGGAGWIDYDNDGDLDLFILGEGDTPIYRNDNGSFTQTDEQIIPDFQGGLYDIGDYDNDGDQDILFSGVDIFFNYGTSIFTNNTTQVNQKPETPTGLSADADGSNVTFSWNASSDAETPSVSLTYHIRLGTTPGGGEIMSSGFSQGIRAVPGPGNAGYGTSWTIHDLANGTYYWSVQAIDQSAQTSEFASEQSFTVTNSDALNFRPYFGYTNPDSTFVQQVSWADYDADGDYDMLLRTSEDGQYFAQLLENEGGFSFSPTNTQFPAFRTMGIAFGDPDNDGDLDLAISGSTSFGDPGDVYLYINEGDAGFVDSGDMWPRSGSDRLLWADFDNDGDQDLLTGSSSWLLNRNGTLIPSNLSAISDSPNNPTNWVDADRDGDNDLYIPGLLIENNNGYFQNPLLELENPYSGYWTDFTQDGFPDLLTIAGLFASNNALPSSSATPIRLPSGTPSRLAIGDVNNDGISDIMSAWDSNDANGSLIEFTQGMFSSQFVGVRYARSPGGIAELSLLDVDQDGRLDLSVSHNDFGLGFYAVLGRVPNENPEPPQQLAAEMERGSVLLSWQPGSDAETPQASLRYNIRVGTTPGGHDVVSPMVHPTTAQSLLPSRTNAGYAPLWSLKYLPTGTYYWAVQTMDTGGRSSAFSTEHSFTIENDNQAIFSVIDPGLPTSNSTNPLYKLILPQDIDGDQDLDLAFTHRENFGDDSEIFSQDNLSFSKVSSLDSTRALQPQTADWGDYDNDGDPDLLTTSNSIHGFQAVVFDNGIDNSFSSIVAFPDSFRNAHNSWVDFDHDGDLDIVGVGQPFDFSAPKTSWLYTLHPADSVQVDTLALPGINHCTLSPFDYDNDGDFDLLAGGLNDGNTRCDAIPILYRNNAQSFEAISFFEGETSSFARWGDYNADGHADLLLATYEEAINATLFGLRVFRNNGQGDLESVFYRVFPDASFYYTVEWIDLNTDGLLDILVSTGNYSYGLLNINDDSFISVDINLPAVANRKTAVGDFDGDYDQDILLPTFIPESNGSQALLYVNNSPSTNTPPASPNSLTFEIAEADTVWLQWQPAMDDLTPATGLSYQLRVGTTPGGHEVLSGAARPYGVAGNVGYNLAWPLILPPDDTYYWAVQAIDASGAPSDWAESTVMFEDVSIDNNPSALPTEFAIRGQYPNPATYTLNVVLDVPQPASVNISVFNVLGQEVLTLKGLAIEPGWEQRVALDISTLKAGIYLYQVRWESSNKTSQNRFVVIR